MATTDISVTPYDSSGAVKKPNIPNLNYTNQDFWSMKTRLVKFINERFGPQGTVLPNTFNDFVESSIAVMLIENWAFLADTLSFKIDQIVNEIFIDTVTEVENAFRLAKLVGFQPQPPIAARSLWVATMNNPLLTDVVITTPLAVDVVSNDTPISIELFQGDIYNNPLFDNDIVIPAGATVNRNIVGLEGRTRQDLFTGTGEVAQTYQLNDYPVIYDSIRLSVDGIQWDRVDYFTDSSPRREYRIEFDSDWYGYIIFGNNRAGLIPSQSSQIEVIYRVGGGIVGNIVTGFIQTQTQAAVPGLGYTVPISLRNYTKGEFGYDGDSLDDIRTKLPLWLRTQDRAVSGEDYKTLCDQFATAYHGQIGKANAVLRNYGCSGNIIDIYILARDGTDGLAEASSELKVDLNAELNKKKMLTDFVCLKDGVIIWVDVEIDIIMDKMYKKSEKEFVEKINQRVNDFFALNNWEYGQTLKDTDIIKALSDIQEISSAEVHFVTNDDLTTSGIIVTSRFFEIIRPDQTNTSFVYE
jgi:hypothetical protein